MDKNLASAVIEHAYKNEKISNWAHVLDGYTFEQLARLISTMNVETPEEAIAAVGRHIEQLGNEGPF